MSWTPETFDTKDLPGLAKFFKKQIRAEVNFGSMDVFQWKAIDNVVKPAVITLVKNKSDIISTAGIIPKKLYLKGQPCEAGELGDCYTDKAFLRQGLFLLVLNDCTQKSFDNGLKVLYGTPNDIAMKVYEAKTKYKLLKEIQVRNLSFRVHIKHPVEKKTHRLLGMYADSVFQTFSAAYFQVRRFLSKSKSIAVSEVTELGDDWNIFWEKARVSYDFVLAKDAQTFSWRFFDSPNFYRTLVARDENGICGYAVYRITGSGNNTTLIVADYLALESSSTALPALLYRLREEAVKANVTCIGVWASMKDHLYNQFVNFGFSECENIKIICYETEFSDQNVKTCQRWHFTMGDSDNI